MLPAFIIRPWAADNVERLCLKLKNIQSTFVRMLSESFSEINHQTLFPYIPSQCMQCRDSGDKFNVKCSSPTTPITLDWRNHKSQPRASNTTFSIAVAFPSSSCHQWSLFSFLSLVGMYQKQTLVHSGSGTIR